VVLKEFLVRWRMVFKTEKENRPETESAAEVDFAEVRIGSAIDPWEGRILNI
jgi:hypothetical protein